VGTISCAETTHVRSSTGSFADSATPAAGWISCRPQTPPPPADELLAGRAHHGHLLRRDGGVAGARLDALVANHARRTLLAALALLATLALRALLAGRQLAAPEVDAPERAVRDLRAGDGVALQLRAPDAVCG